MEFFRGVPELWQRPKAKNNAIEDPFFVQIADNNGLRPELGAGPVASQRVPRANPTSKDVLPPTQIIQGERGSLASGEGQRPWRKGRLHSPQSQVNLSLRWGDSKKEKSTVGSLVHVCLVPDFLICPQQRT